MLVMSKPRPTEVVPIGMPQPPPRQLSKGWTKAGKRTGALEVSIYFLTLHLTPTIFASMVLFATIPPWTFNHCFFIFPNPPSALYILYIPGKVVIE